MPIDYRRLVVGLSASCASRLAGPASLGAGSRAEPGGLAAIDALMSTAAEATAAVGATFTARRDPGARVVAAAGAMAWALGRPVTGELVGGHLEQPWAGRSEELPATLAAHLTDRGIRGVVGHPAWTEDGFVGAVHLFFDRLDLLEPMDQSHRPSEEMRAVLSLIAAAVAHVHEEPEQRVPLAAPSDDRMLFLAAAGHELRTPVTVIKGYASLLADRWEHLSDSERRDAAQVLAQRSNELARVVDRLLDAWAGGRTDESSLVASPFDPVAVARHAVAQLPADLRERVHLDPPASLPPAHGDPSVLASVVTELVTNAVRSLRSGHATSRSAESAPVQVEIGADAQTVYLRVCDRGSGIDPANVERAFERFWRAHEDDARGGVGLGLYLVRRLVERQNGWVSLRPRDGGGTVAEVRLRRADAGDPPPDLGKA